MRTDKDVLEGDTPGASSSFRGSYSPMRVEEYSASLRIEAVKPR
jgi:hypothetical protein